jgi:type III pantothenate kinase
MADVVRTAVAQTWQMEAEFVTSTPIAGGVRNAYPQPAKLGVDRWLAMIGAHALERDAVCIVSVGTAMTIDGVAADGRHLGGVILPGPDLMITSLLTNTSDIAQRALQGDAGDRLFADNTLGAIRQGAQHALAALIERAVGVMRRTLNETPKLLVTGGASDRVEKAIGLPYRAVPDLVLQGLAVLAREPRP